MLCREAEFLKLKMPTKKVSDDASAPKGSPGLCLGSRLENNIGRVRVVRKKPKGASAAHPPREGRRVPGSPGRAEVIVWAPRRWHRSPGASHKHKHRESSCSTVPMFSISAGSSDSFHMITFSGLLGLFFLISENFKLGTPCVPGAQGGLRVYL